MFIEYKVTKMFKEYLLNNNLEGLKSIPKSDLHNHASNGGNPKFIEKLTGLSFEAPPKLFNSIQDTASFQFF